MTRLTKKRRCAILGAMILTLGFPLAAQDSVDEDALFGDMEMIEAVPESQDTNAANSMLVTKAVRVGGNFSGSADVTMSWDDPWTNGMDPRKADDYKLDPALSTLLFFDARPSEGARFYGSMKTGWPFYTEKEVLTGATSSTLLRLPDIRVFELFTDFNWNDKAFFRFGKQTVTWGVGYFFSPADVLNLEAIDPFNPTVQREGPVTLRMNIPIPNSQHNIWAYGIVDTKSLVPEDIAAALKGEFVIGGWEIGLGGYYKRDNPLRAVLTASGSIKAVSLFGEATVSRGADRSWASSISSTTPGFMTMTEDKTSAFFKGTTGFMYSNSDWKMTFAGQYLFDGEGYANVDREDRIAEAHSNETAIKALLAFSTDDPDAAFSGILKGLIANSGRHYAALSISRTELFTEDLSLSVFGMANLSDLSGFVRPSLSYKVFTGLSASFSALFAFGATDSEYLVLNDGPKVSFSFGLSFGSGSF